MMHNLTKILVALLLTSSMGLYAQSQYDFMKYGKIDLNDLKMTQYAKDTNAEAAVLGDYGNVYFQINDIGDGWEIVYERHVRIKLFTKKAYSYANVEIPLYRGNRKEEKVLSLKGATYYLQDGEIKKENLKSDNIFTEVVSERGTKQKFAMPAIKEGCIIEYQYTMVSGFIFSLASWTFQYHIPVIRSEFNARIPKYFIYNPTMKGYLALTEDLSDQRDEIFTIPYRTLPKAGGVVEQGKYNITSLSTIKHWIMKDIPAFKTEPFISNENNFISSLSFELSSYTFPGDSKQAITETWESINTDLLEDVYFGEQLLSAKYLDDELSPIKSKITEPEEKIKAVYETLKKLVKWNDIHSIYASKYLRKIYTQHTGNSADINLMLVFALRECGINAVPVVLSTRDNGIIIPAHPTLTHINHVIALVKLPGKTILLDATDPLVPMGLLPEECINGQGYLVQPGLSEWISLDSLGTYCEVSSIDLEMAENNSFKGKVSSLYKDYAGIEKRKHLKELNSEEKLAEELQGKYPEGDLSDFKVMNKDSIYQALRIDFVINILNKENKGMMYINPFLGDNKFENPFKQEERIHPIDFIYPRNETFLFKFKLPVGYEIAEKPESIIMSLPDKSMKVMFTVNEIGDLIQVMYKLNMMRSIYQASEYGDIRALFTEIVKKQNENIVIRKKI